VPLVAITTLDATTFQLGVLVALQTAAFLVIGLPAGAWCDRMRKRPVLITTDLVRAALLLSIPAAALLDRLTLPHLYLVVAAHGVATVFFDVSYQSYLPHLVGRARLVEGNGKLEASRTVAHAVGPATGGYLVQWFTAPTALVAPTTSSDVAMACLASIPATYASNGTVSMEPPPPRRPRVMPTRTAKATVNAIMAISSLSRCWTA